MGRYLRKQGKTMETANDSCLGVTTRGKSRKRAVSSPCPSSASYLELRTRRLLKVRRGQDDQQDNSECSGDSKSVSVSSCRSKKSYDKTMPGMHSNRKTEEHGKATILQTKSSQDYHQDGCCSSALMEACFGESESLLGNDQFKGRKCRESTASPRPRARPSSSSVEAVSSTAKSPAPGRKRKGRKREAAPPMHEMEDFFAVAEKDQQKIFIERYNYDPVNDKPLAGRYEWMRVG